MRSECDFHNWRGAGRCPECQVSRLGTAAAGDSAATRIAKPVNYIATYSAQCVDGSAIQANLSLSLVPVGTSPGVMIEVVTEQAYADIARSGKNATQVVVLNLSRVW